MGNSDDQIQGQQKTRWNSRFAFLMAMIGSAVGLGNIWRFNYVLYSQGGGAFLIPYITAIIVMGLPFLILEYGVGYHLRDSLSNILKRIKPYLEVVGWFILLIVFLILTYYLVIVGWDVIYLALSFFKGWGADPNMFFSNNIVVGGDDLNSITSFVLPMSLITILLWIVLWYTSCKSIDRIEKIVKSLIPLLFLLMAFIVFYSLTLPGHMIGLQALFRPKWELLSDPSIWVAAFGQVLFSLSMGLSIAITYASYLPDESEITGNVVAVAFSNSFFELFTAIGVFSILGYMSLQSGLPIDQLATSGAGLSFIVFPQVFNVMGNSAYILGPVFFLCIFFAGLTSLISLFETMRNALSMKFGFTRRKSSTILTIFGLVISLVYTTGSGSFILTIADAFLNNMALILGVILQAVIFGWMYGVEKLIPAINKNSKLKVGKTWTAVIKYILPVILSLLWICEVIDVITFDDINVLIIQIIIAAILIIAPIVLTKLPAKDENSTPKID
ncbi:MAG: sodium-dependent transporter [Methanosphaera sp.]|uniref:sodium-dependent transporter n=1 Tax=Methanosphaera sp. TaxID=2666342 RepID=UPI0025D3AB23|nr:sodium-dependent transporter [Methanosphaera sp.]MDD6535105.1 sodium-dependent transporter [Methanosphaera sp.]MDY3955915.1 sodium-dependent transporter [Methanosphaera sp.]